MSRVASTHFAPVVMDYSQSQAVGVSSMTGAGIKEFFEAVEASRTEYAT